MNSRCGISATRKRRGSCAIAVTRLARDHELSQYTTSVAVRDLDAVRAALGYERISLYGSSYGTRVAQHYLRRYPARTTGADPGRGRATDPGAGTHVRHWMRRTPCNGSLPGVARTVPARSSLATAAGRLPQLRDKLASQRSTHHAGGSAQRQADADAVFHERARRCASTGRVQLRPGCTAATGAAPGQPRTAVHSLGGAVPANSVRLRSRAFLRDAQQRRLHRGRAVLQGRRNGTEPGLPRHSWASRSSMRCGRCAPTGRADPSMRISMRP